MKKVLSLVLALTMLCGMIATIASAADYTLSITQVVAIPENPDAEGSAFLLVALADGEDAAAIAALTLSSVAIYEDSADWDVEDFEPVEVDAADYSYATEGAYVIISDLAAGSYRIALNGEATITDVTDAAAFNNEDAAVAFVVEEEEDYSEDLSEYLEYYVWPAKQIYTEESWLKLAKAISDAKALINSEEPVTREEFKAATAAVTAAYEALELLENPKTPGFLLMEAILMFIEKVRAFFADLFGLS